MAIQSPEKAAEVVNAWFARHPELVGDNHNADVLGLWIKKNHGVAGELVLTDASLEMAYQALAASGQLNFYASHDTQAQIAETQQRLAALTADKKQREAADAEAAKKTALRNKLIAEQQAQGPGRASAMAGANEAAAEQARQVSEREKTAQRSLRHASFVEELRAANQFLLTTPSGLVKWGATNDTRTQMKAVLAKKYPEFKSEITE
jgi:hypothetical protein